ncbi:MAG: sugar phosphate isomerase/epimerase [Clostridia bacterium]|nr:sugar phosphate isomerase/epimerase [Clostridia bacterium]
MKEFGLQIYSIRDHFTTPEDTRESFRIMKECGYSHAQTAGTYSYMPAEDFRALADEYGIKLMGTHYSWTLICNEVEETVKYHKTIGAEYVGIGSMPKEARESKDALLAFIAKFNEMAKIYVENGFKALTYHNHSFEFVKIEGKTIMDYLIEGFDPRYTAFVLDSFWAHVGGEDVRALIERLDGRIACVHLKDLDPCFKYELADGKTMSYLPKRIEVGCGNMKFEGIIKTAEACGCKYFTVEDEHYTTGESYDSVRISAENIKAKFLEK